LFKKEILKFKYTFYCQTHIQTQTTLKNVTKPNSVRCKNLNGIVAEFYYILMTADRHTVLEMGRESKYIFLYLHILKQLQTLSGLTWCDINTFTLRILGLWYTTETKIFWNIYPAGISRKKKNISVYQWPQKGTIFRSGSSVTVLNILYVWPVFRSDLILFLLHSVSTAVFS